MSQLIACQNAHGIVLATDGQAIDFDHTGKMIELTMDRLVQLTKQTAILTGGAADGAEMCHALRNFLQEEIGPPFSFAFITKEGFRRVD